MYGFFCERKTQSACPLFGNDNRFHLGGKILFYPAKNKYLERDKSIYFYIGSEDKAPLLHLVSADKLLKENKNLENLKTSLEKKNTEYEKRHENVLDQITDDTPEGTYTLTSTQKALIALANHDPRRRRLYGIVPERADPQKGSHL